LLQVSRLESALLQESNQPTDAGDGSASRKRGRNSKEDAVSTASEKIKATDKFRNMNIKQLREEATLRGISATGSKKELLERLSEDSDKDSADIAGGRGMSFHSV
jgi:poly [ADP-ribose] polymerase